MIPVMPPRIFDTVPEIPILPVTTAEDARVNFTVELRKITISDINLSIIFLSVASLMFCTEN
jgi:hypothetical protein